MLFFRATKKPPEGYEFFTFAQWEYFAQLVKEYWEHQGATPLIEGGVLTIQGREGRMGLLNIAQQCFREKKSQWSRLVGRHFDNIAKAGDEQKIFTQNRADFEKVRELLAVRLYPEELHKGRSDTNAFVYRSDFPGTVSALVIDFPSSVSTVRRDDAMSWGKSDDELFAIGVENVLKKYPAKPIPYELKGGYKIGAFLGDDVYVTTSVLAIEKYPAYVGSYGTLFGIPHRQTFMCYPIENADVISVVNKLCVMIDGMYREGPGSISPHLYWYRDGETIVIPHEMIQGKLHVSPPQKFISLINELVEKK